MPGPAYLHGETVELRTIETDDINFLQEMINDPELWQGFGAPGPRNRAEMEERFEEQNGDAALLVCRDGTPEGRVRLVDINEQWGNAELTCYIRPESQGEGLATEACQLLIEYGFDYLPVTKLTARVFESNRVSRNLVETLGFTQEGTLRNHVYHQGEYLDLYVYGLLESER